ncbi:hypothetical protein JCM30760_20680 [Thiomicrorhabdus hydrogeniphila]
MNATNALNNRPQVGVMLHITPQGDQLPGQTYDEFTELVQTIDALGFDEAWITEHHFTPYSLTPSPLLMMGHFLTHTQNLKLGTAAVLLGFHNPIEVAEQLAVLNTLHPNRILCGFAKGGPFESQNATFKINADSSRARLQEAVPALLGLLKQPQHNHKGEFYDWKNVSLQPMSTFSNEQFFLATSHPSTLELAAQNNMGLMAAQFWPISKITSNIEGYEECHPHNYRPNMMVARGVFIDDDSTTAKNRALAHIHHFRTQKSQLWGKHKGPMHKLTDDQLLNRVLCGTVDEVIAQTKSLLNLGVARLGLNPLTENHECRLHQLERFYTEVWPAVNHVKMSEDSMK